MLDEAFYEEVARYRESERFSERERLAMEYAERFALDHLSIDDRFFERLLGHFDDAEVLDLTFCIARWLGFGRLTQVLGLDVACPVHASRI